MAYMIYYGSDVLFDPIGDDSVTDCKITASSNNPDYLDFTISYGHSLYSTIAERAAIVKVFWDDTCLFIGEIESIDIDYEGNKDVSCNGALAWLEDTLVRPYSTVSGEQPLTAPSSVNGLFQWYIDQYNEHAYSANHPFNVDTNQGAALDSNNYIYRSSSSTATVWSEISSKILDELGGYLFLDYGDGTSLTLNLYADVHEMNSQIIDFGVNITDFSKSIETSSQYTAIRPSGYTPSAPEDDPNKKMFPITIESVTDGATSYDTNLTKHGDVIYSIDAIRRYGYREYGYSDTDIETVDGLMQAACKALNKILSPELSITVKAVDLALYMEGYTHLRVGQAVRIRSAFHDTDEYLMVSSMTLNLNNPGSTEYELGTSYDSLTGQQSSYMKSLNSGINTALDTTATLSDDVKSAATEAKDAATAAAEAASQAASAQSTATEAKDAADSASSAATEAKNTAEKTASDLTTAVSDLQKQIDGSIETWFYEIEPTTDNEPAVNWTTDAEKNKHLGDLYYDTKTGYCYRWQIQNGTYSWGRIADTDVAKALEAAKTAKDVADHKRTIFVDTPTVPYDIGDMWVQGENGDILVATVAKASTETYSAKDWVIASKYTDDSLAQVAKDTADKAVIETTTEYTTTSSPTTVPTDDAEWDPATPAYEEGKYIWMHQIVTYGDGTTETTKPVLVTGNDGYSPTVSIDKQNDKTVITITDKTGDHTGTISDGSKGDKGDTGNGISSATVEYTSSTSGTVAPSSGWKSSIPDVEKGSYLWTKTTTSYTSGSPTYSYSVAYIAEDGTSTTIKSATTTYQAGTSATAIPTGTWQEISKVTVPQGGYLWSKTVVTYSDGTSTDAYGVSYSAKDGKDGAGFAWNLLPGTSTAKGWSEYNSFDSATRTFTRTTSATSECFVKYYGISVTVGETYTLSADIWSNGYVKSVDMFCFGKNVKKPLYRNITPTTTATRYTFTFTVPEVSGEDWSLSTIRFDNNGTKTSGTAASLYVRDIKLEKGSTASPWCTTQAETVGSDGASVSAVKIQYYSHTSGTEAPSSTADWKDYVPDWQSGHYIWQRTQTTIGGKTVTGDPVLYGAFNSLATSVEGNTSSIQQLPTKLEAKFVTLDADRLSGDDWIKDPYFLNGATNTDKWNGDITLAVGSKTQTTRDSYWQAGAALRKVSKGQKFRLALTANDTGCTTGTNVGLGFRVANASKVWQTWIVPLQLGTTHSATHTGSYIYTVPDSYDGYYFAPFTQLAVASSTTPATGTCVFSYIQVTDITAAATDYSTLIRATSDGIEVGKADTSGTLSGVHTLMGTDTFSIHTKDHKVMSSVDANKFTFASGEAYVGKATAPTQVGSSAFGIFSSDNQSRPIALVPGRNGNTDNFAYIYVWPSDTAGDLAYASLIASKDDYSRWSYIETTYLDATLNHIADNTVTSLDVGKGYVDIRSDELMFSKSGVASAEFTIAMDTFRDYLKPKVWRFGEYARGESKTSTLGTGWITASYMQRVQISGPSNYTDYFKFVSGVITAVKAGYFRVRFHLTCKHTGSGGRYGAAVMMGSTYGDVSFQYSNSSIDYNDCVAEYVDYLAVGSTMTVKEHATVSGIVKNLDGNRSNVTVEYLGA